jgi:hypothetical protein
MALIRLEQILSPLRASGSNLYMSGSFAVTGSATFIQGSSSSFAIASSGSLYIIDNPPTTGSLEGNPLDGGSF